MLTRAKLTADRNPVLNIDAGVVGDRFYLATGGDIENTGTPLWKTLDRPPRGVVLPEGWESPPAPPAKD